MFTRKQQALRLFLVLTAFEQFLPKLLPPLKNQMEYQCQCGTKRYSVFQLKTQAMR